MSPKCEKCGDTGMNLDSIDYFWYEDDFGIEQYDYLYTEQCMECNPPVVDNP